MTPNFATVFAVLEQSASHDYIGESISQLEHALQCADFALASNEEPAVICAALFHDIGHFCREGVESMDGLGAKDHEAVGADFLRAQGFPERVCNLILGHVQAKRYLVTTRPEYSSRLSEASRRTLDFQGGFMTADEVSAFEADPLMKTKLRLRAWDEAAKIENHPTQPLAYYRSLFETAL